MWIDGRRLAFLDASDSDARVVLIDVNDDASSMRLHTRDLKLSQIVIGELLRPGQTPGSVVFVDAITTYRANEEGTGITLHRRRSGHRRRVRILCRQVAHVISSRLPSP